MSIDIDIESINVYLLPTICLSLQLRSKNHEYCPILSIFFTHCASKCQNNGRQEVYINHCLGNERMSV